MKIVQTEMELVPSLERLRVSMLEKGLGVQVLVKIRETIPSALIWIRVHLLQRI